MCSDDHIDLGDRLEHPTQYASEQQHAGKLGQCEEKPCWLSRARLQSGLEARALDRLPLPPRAVCTEYTTVETLARPHRTLLVWSEASW